VISLRPIGDGNRGAVEALRVSPIQEQFVASVAESLVEAVEDPGGRAIYWAIYADEIPVGIVMISDEVDGPGYIALYLWRPLIDRRYQGRGYGTAALDPVVEYFRRRTRVEAVWTSCGQGDRSPLGSSLGQPAAPAACAGPRCDPPSPRRPSAPPRSDRRRAGRARRP
jgi:GNAT superfamily N-acetyltransferase